MKVISVKFKENGRSYYFDPCDFQIKEGDYVIVTTARGTEFGRLDDAVFETTEEQVKSLLAQRVENYKSDVESLTGTAPLELADNGDHFSYPGVIDGERDELPL